MVEYLYSEKLKVAIKRKRVMPYLTIMLGPTKELCPIHAKDKGLILPVEHEYWVQFPMRETKACRCDIRGVTEYEYQKLKKA